MRAMVAFQARIDRSPVGLHDIDGIEHILDESCVIHGTSLEVPAVGQNLLGDLLLHQGQAPSQPAFGFLAVEIKPGENQRFCVGEHVIALQVRFDAPIQPARLYRKALPRLRRQCIARAATT